MSELLFPEILLHPATFDVLWTTTVTGLLLTATAITTWLLPWSNQEVMAVHQAAHTSTLAFLQTVTASETSPLPLPASRDFLPTVQPQRTSPQR